MTTTAARSRDTYHVGNLAPRLLGVAREMLEEVGPTKLSLRAIAERVGVSSAAAYHHYANRAELIEHLAAQGFCELAHALAQRDANETGMRKLRDSSIVYLRFARSNPALYQLMFGPEFATGEMIPALLTAREQAFGELKSTIAEVLQGDVQAPEVRRAARAAWSFTHGLASLVIHGILHIPEGSCEERFLDGTLHGFGHLFQIGGKE
ncbi:TetR/AcrR family transcriptional regulator [Burkholderia orbicola]|uniref:TetR/AcrR family transcriptional regulator n=1 Tax=Burkholderia orbicola TaxID=2978683 RepID=UPI0035C6F5B5